MLETLLVLTLRAGFVYAYWRAWQDSRGSARTQGLKMGKWGLNDTIANDESFLSFGQLSFGVPDVRGSDDQTQVFFV